MTRNTPAAELAALFERDLLRLEQELRAFPDTESLWRTAPGVSNAAGTLALHLEGNLREYVGRLLGGVGYHRDRPLEFSARGVSREELIQRIQALRGLIPPVIARLSDQALAAPYPEPFSGTVLPARQFLVHLFGHFSYHLGQLDYLRRFATGDPAIELASL